MKTRSIFTAIAVVVFSVGVTASAANAAPPTNVVIHLHPCVFAPMETGIWDASGAINDSGIYERTEARTSPPERAFGATGPFHEEFLLEGLKGTFTVKTNTRVTSTGAPGVWIIEPGGTGDYADASGHGDFAFSAGPGPSCFGPGVTFTVTLTGVAGKIG